MSDSEIAEICSDYIILDEFHRCGADMWGKGVAKLLGTFPNVPVLGLSATAVRYLDNRRDMADELFDGNVASEMTLGEAIVRGILNPPKYVLSVYSYQKDLELLEVRVKNAGEGNRKRQLTDEQKCKLESVGMVFGKTASDEACELQFANAKAYFEQHGNLNVSKDYVADDGRRLGVWIIAQKNFYRQGKLSAERISRLFSVGLKFTASPWEVGVAHAREYAAKYNNLNVPSGYICADGYRLGSWIKNQRTAKKNGKLNKNKVDILNSIGMTWSINVKRNMGKDSFLNENRI